MADIRYFGLLFFILLIYLRTTSTAILILRQISCVEVPFVIQDAISRPLFIRLE